MGSKKKASKKKVKKPTKKIQMEALDLIARGAALLDWELAFNGKAKRVDYFILGKAKDVTRILELIDDTVRK